ncbi:MAG: 2-amino-4-hydroxy-6-hydroxymethyldihydropteridine diphosphokinase [Pseudomonadota bacterium]
MSTPSSRLLLQPDKSSSVAAAPTLSARAAQATTHLAYIALGANLNEPARQIQAAVLALNQLTRSKLLSCSRCYQSAPILSAPSPSLQSTQAMPRQADYINAVAALETQLDAHQLLAALLAIEAQFGRRREAHEAARTLDLDLLLFDQEVIHEPAQSVVAAQDVDNTASSVPSRRNALYLPHPRMHLRAFVLLPLLEIAPDCLIPGRGRADAWRAAVSMQSISLLHSP